VRVEDLVRAVGIRVAECRGDGQGIDYITLVPDGEPTLDLRLAPEIRRLKTFGIPVAVITNGSLLGDPKVRSALAEADVVSVKVDAVDPRTWRRINRPGKQLRLPAILEGLELFARSFSGETWTETMLVGGINDHAEGVEQIACFLERIEPARAYVAVPTRPPAVAGVVPPPARAVSEAHEVFRRRFARVELLASPEEGTFGHGADPKGDLLAILAVHPMSEAAARGYLEEAGTDPAILDELLAAELVVRVVYHGDAFILGEWGGAAVRH
jgi:wyosine [tRNA(Phe)-imidazoG37] synthetase (radical SAM superfamily)